MQHFIRRSLYVAVLLVMPVLLASGSFAWDFDDSDPNLLLNGEYRTSIFESCVQTEGVFDADFNVPAGGGFRSRSIGAITTYNGDQTGDFTALVLNIFAPVSTGAFRGVSQSSTDCKVTYPVNPDRSFTQTLTMCLGTILTGPSTGDPFTLSDIVLQGQIARGWRRKILSYTNNDTNVITVTLRPEGPDKRVFERICAASGTGVKCPRSGCE